MKRRILFQIAVLFSWSAFAQVTQLPSWIQNTVYIDPTYTGSESGTLNEPYKSTKSIGFAWSAKNAYLFKRNTTLNASSTENLSADSIVIGAYGSGKRPILSYNVLAAAISVSGTGSIINDINLIIPQDMSSHGIVMGGDYGIINNCLVNGGNSGIRGAHLKHLKVLNTEVIGAIGDGMYINPADTVTITNCYFHDQYLLPDLTNQGSIDNVHMENLKMVYIDSLYSDHSNFPGKFCLILNNPDSVSVKNSVFIGFPKGGAVYPGTSKNGWSIQNCYFEGGLYAIQNNAKLRIYNSVFRGQVEDAIFEGDDKWIFNCTFIDQYNVIRNWFGSVRELKNCVFYNYNASIAGNYDSTTMTNNCFFKGILSPHYSPIGKNAIQQDPGFVDYANQNFRLSSGSPCINMGITVPGDTLDILGNKRGAQIDIGAYEYFPGIPTVFDVTTDGTGCEHDTASIKLSGSENNTSYTLCRNNVKLSQVLVGNGSTLNFGRQGQWGFYSVVASKNGNNLTNKMNGNVALLVNPLPKEYFIVGGGFYNSAIGGAPIGLYLSESDISYQLYNNNSMMGNPVAGSGDSISFGIQSEEGKYTVIATNTLTDCKRAMPNFVIIAHITSVAEVKESNLLIVPNPSSGSFVINLDIPSNDIFDLSIYNLKGSLIYKKNVQSGQDLPITISVPAGEYIVKLNSSKYQFKPVKLMITNTN